MSRSAPCHYKSVERITLNSSSLFSFCLKNLLLVSLVACGQKSLERFDSPAEISSVENAKSYALEWLNEAQYSDELTDSEKSLSLKIKNQLLSKQILPTPSVLSSQCAEDGNNFVAAFVSHQDTSSIFVCNRGLEHGDAFLAQVFIHESIHLEGTLDECQTTYLERKIISAGGGVPFDNSYVAECGLE